LAWHGVRRRTDGLSAEYDVFAADLGWRFAFGLGALLGLVILLVRRNVPDSPRWMFVHGRDNPSVRSRERR
jgi:MFS family permease